MCLRCDFVGDLRDYFFRKAWMEKALTNFQRVSLLLKIHEGFDRAVQAVSANRLEWRQT